MYEELKFLITKNHIRMTFACIKIVCLKEAIELYALFVGTCTCTLQSCFFYLMVDSDAIMVRKTTLVKVARTVMLSLSLHLVWLCYLKIVSTIEGEGKQLATPITPENSTASVAAMQFMEKQKQMGCLGTHFCFLLYGSCLDGQISMR